MNPQTGMCNRFEIIFSMMLKYFLRFLFVIIIAVVFIHCSGTRQNIISEINIGTHNNNELKIEIDVTTTADAKVFIEYWPDSIGVKGKMQSPVSDSGLNHSIVICNILPQTKYSFQIVSEANKTTATSSIYTFQSRPLPEWMRDQFRSVMAEGAKLPAEFKNGLMLTNKREAPGTIFMVDYLGQLKWYHMVDGTGIKVTHFTNDTTIISILGKNDEPTSYGSEILEINLFGDTLLHLKKGEKDFKYTIHHEIRKRKKNEIVTLFVEDRIMDLRSIGGGEKDTVKGDGILILDTTGRKIWQWSVFDAENPLKDPRLLKDKKDWMHANSLNFDADSNFIISFYNTGQIWKIDAATGKVMWKFGKGGNVKMPANCDFTEVHAAHINANGSLLFFDNGVAKRQSEVFAMKMNGENKTSAIDFHFKLPIEVYNERMGSAYMVGDSTVLCCCSKRHLTVLANKKGEILWKLQTGTPPYRAEFLRYEQLAPYLKL
jgi:hypothetical protein